MVTNKSHLHLQKVQPMAGFAATDIPPEAFGWILTRAFACSDDPAFYLYCDQISKMFLNRYFIDAINHYLVLIHIDLSADVYVNNFPIQVKMLPKRTVKAGEPVSQNDIANITELRFLGIDIKEDDCVIFCFKKGWKFGLFFDFCQADRNTILNVKRLSHDLGSYYRYLTFQEVYSVLENEIVFEAMFSDGWFPFIQLLGSCFQELSRYYTDKSSLSSNIEAFINKFDKEHIYLFVNRWWSSQLFKGKQTILEAGIDAFISVTKSGYINCVKTLYSEIEGIVRISYVREKGKDPNFKELIKYVEEKASGKFGAQGTLGFSDVFYRYLKEVVFKNFDLSTGEVDLSRHTVSHGVADQTDYTKIKAFQAILILDQMYFYLT